jgi:hypothetical protein
VAITYRSGVLYRNAFTYRGHVKTIQQLSARARIVTLQTISAQTRLSKLQTSSLYSKAWIKAPQRISARTRISKQQGWPIPDVGYPGYITWQDTRIYSRAKLYQYIAFPTQTIRSKARVTYGKTLSVQTKARIVTAQTLQARANILPKFFTTHVSMTFSVQRSNQRKLRVMFFIDGAAHNQQLTAKARILQSYTNRVTGHFIVPMTTAFNTVISIPDPLTNVRTQQTLSVRTRVTK